MTSALKIIYQGTTRNGHQITIRYPMAEDTAKLQSYFNTVSSEQTLITFQGEQLSLADEEKYLKEQLEKIKKGDAIVLYVFCDDKLIGVCDINRQEKIEKHVGRFGLIIAKDFRGEGIGQLLMKLVFEDAKKNITDLKIVVLGCFANNPIALKIYEKFGFKEYGRLPQGIIYKGDLVDHVYMYKLI